MSHFIKVIYESASFNLTTNQWEGCVKEGLAPFEYEDYDTALSYRDNMDSLIDDFMSNGIVILTDGKSVPIFRVYYFKEYSEDQVGNEVENNIRPQEHLQAKSFNKQFKHKRRFRKENKSNYQQSSHNQGGKVPQAAKVSKNIEVSTTNAVPETFNHVEGDKSTPSV